MPDATEWGDGPLARAVAKVLDRADAIVPDGELVDSSEASGPKLLAGFDVTPRELTIITEGVTAAHMEAIEAIYSLRGSIAWPVLHGILRGIYVHGLAAGEFHGDARHKEAHDRLRAVRRTVEALERSLEPGGDPELLRDGLREQVAAIRAALDGES